jgi:hypothetical protein
MGYSYISNVYPEYTNTVDELYNKMYSDTYNNNVPEQLSRYNNTINKQPTPVGLYEQFSEPKHEYENFGNEYKYTTGLFSEKNKSNILVPSTQALSEPDMYSGYKTNDISNVNTGYLVYPKEKEAYAYPKEKEAYAYPKEKEAYAYPKEHQLVCVEYLNHIKTCEHCRMKNNQMKNENNSLNMYNGEFMDILAYIVFGIMFVLILEKM